MALLGDGHAEVVVAVCGEDDVFGTGNLREQHAEGRGVLLRCGVTDGVGDVDRGGSGLDCDGDDVDEEVGVGAGGVLGRELDIVGEGAGEADGFGGLVERFGAGDLQLSFEMQVGRGEEGVDAGLLGGFDGTGSGFDVLTLAAGKGGDARAVNFAGDLADGVGVALAGDGETGFNDVDAECRQLMGHAQLLFVVHGAARGLLAVAEGGIEEDYLVRRGHRAYRFRSGRYHNACL
jgi:hypothetical protein